LRPSKQLTLDTQSSTADHQRKLAYQQLGIGQGWPIREAISRDR